MGLIAQVLDIQPMGCCKIKLFCPHCGKRVTNSFCPGERDDLRHCGTCGMPWVLHHDGKGGYTAVFPAVGSDREILGG